MKKSKREIYNECVARMDEIMDSAGDSLNEQEQAEFDRCLSVAETLRDENPAFGRQVPPSAPGGNGPGGYGESRPPAVFGGGDSLECGTINNVLRSPIKSFSGTKAEAEKKAVTFGRFVLAVAGHAPSQNWCRSNGIDVLALASEGVNSTGGYLVPAEVSRDIIVLRDSFGVFRRNARVVELSSDALVIPRLTTDLTTYFVNEGGQITSSTKAWDSVRLTLKKIACLSTFTSELASDAIISIADDLAGSISWSIAKTEDSCGFNGNGTSTYGGIVGLTHKLSTLNGVDDGGGLVLGTGNAWSELAIADFCAMIGRTPAYALAGAKWFCSNAFFAGVMLRLAYSSGGVSGAELLSGSMARQFLSYPVELTESMPTSEANSQICCLFGNLAQAATLGGKGGIAIQTSADATVGSTNMFDTDSLAIRGVERFDINVHDVGTASAAGPVVGLITKAS